MARSQRLCDRLGEQLAQAPALPFRKSTPRFGAMRVECESGFFEFADQELRDRANVPVVVRAHAIVHGDVQR